MGYSHTTKKFYCLSHSNSRAYSISNDCDNWGAGYHFFVPFTIFVLLPALFLSLRFRIKRSYRKNPLWQNMEITLIFDRETFVAQSKRGEFHYTYDDIVKVIMTKQDFYILIGESTGFAIEKENCTPEALEFLLELHIEHM